MLRRSLKKSRRSRFALTFISQYLFFPVITWLSHSRQGEITSFHIIMNPPRCFSHSDFIYRMRRFGQIFSLSELDSLLTPTTKTQEMVNVHQQQQQHHQQLSFNFMQISLSHSQQMSFTVCAHGTSTSLRFFTSPHDIDIKFAFINRKGKYADRGLFIGECRIQPDAINKEILSLSPWP
jgi:hypothetical protein